ncbi:MAG: tetratricopeptide repeat protein [Microcoleus vaginatus WJT46-NPBG5]|nr:tetratricopeptide repeat protein [Microcoleus vaginatus WJT46-NPBG5]
MDEQHMAAYYQLIQKLLECADGEEPQILNANLTLIDPGFLEAIIAVAKQLNDNDNQNVVKKITILALQLGEFLGSERQPTAIRKQTVGILFKWGTAQYYISWFVVACECWKRCISIYQAIHDRQGEAASLGNLGNAYLSLGQFEQAIDYHQQSLAISREIKDRQVEANSIRSLGNAYQSLGQFEQAIDYHQQYLAISREIKDRHGEADSLKNLGNAYESLGQFERAINYHEQYLAISREIKNRLWEADSLKNLGIAYYNMGQFERAIPYHEKCLSIFREIEHRKGEAAALGNLGIAYCSLRQFERGINFLQQCLAIFEEIKDPQREAIILESLGSAYNSTGQYEQAILYYTKHLTISWEIKDRKEEAISLLGLGNAYHYLGQFETAISYHEQSLAIRREIKDRRGEADALGNLGASYHSLGQFKRAIDFCQQYLEISQEIKDRKGEANALGSLGFSCLSLGQLEAAISYFEESLAIRWQIKDREGEGSSLLGLGNAYLCQGQFEQAIARFHESLAIHQEIKKRRGEADALGNLGAAYESLGQFERAIDYHEQSLAIKREIKDRLGEGNSLGNLGIVYDSLGQLERAIDFHQQYLEISQEMKDRSGEAKALGNLGCSYLSIGQFQTAIYYQQQCLEISQEIKYLQGEASSLGNLAIAHCCLEKYEQAIPFYEQQLVIVRDIKDSKGEANCLVNLGNAYRQLQQREKALENYRDCLKIATPEIMPVQCFKVGQNLGDTGFTQGNWQLALEGYEPAMQAVENIRKGSTTDKRRQEIIKDAISVYANAVQCYINLKQYDKAVETADRSRSRHLADLFYSSKDLYPKGEIPPEVEEYYRLQQQGNRLRISENDGTKALATTSQATPNGEAILETIKDLEAEKQKAWLKIRSKDQVLAGQLQPDPLSFKQMQALIPDAETAILNFYTTGEHTHIFILRQNQASKLHTCQGQGHETLQFWIFNNWLKLYIGNQAEWQSQMGGFLSELASRLQLNQLISEHLKDIKELIIIPHLYLHQIPFAALPLNNTPIPHSETNSDKTRGLKPASKPSNTSATTPPQQPEYLSDKFRIRIVPSCQILNFCHQRGNLKPATMGIVENATGDLVFTGYECETLATMHQVDQNSRLQYQQATIDNYQNLINGVQVLHSSHHASSQLNNSLESKLHLFDGDINLGRVFTWRFSHLAEVFLSCCETNLSLTQITDDPLSIASGFLCAGARNVVSTLWSVEDLATALFCILYYKEKQNKSRSEAIRQAQIKLRNLTGDELDANYKHLLEAYFNRQQWGENQTEIVKHQRLRLDWLCRQPLPFVSPYYWSGFVSQGLA